MVEIHQVIHTIMAGQAGTAVILPVLFHESGVVVRVAGNTGIQVKRGYAGRMAFCTGQGRVIIIYRMVRQAETGMCMIVPVACILRGIEFCSAVIRVTTSTGL